MKEKHYCKCCLSQECYKDMANDYYFGNKIENYCDMLINVFNIKITTDNGQRNLICEECVSKLRDAAAFKRKVLDIQEAMRNRIGWESFAADLSKKFEDNNNAIYDCNLELSDTVENSDFHWENFTDTEKGQTLVISLNQDKFDSKETQKSMFPINDTSFSRNDGLKTTNNLKLKTKRSVKNSNVTVSKENLQIPTENDDSKNHLTNAIINDEDYTNDIYAKLIDSEDDDYDFEDNIKDSDSRIIKKKSCAAKQIKTEKKKEESKQKDPHLKWKSENTLKLIQNSNLCLFRSFRNKFGCVFCPLKYPEFSHLRDHYSTHRNPKTLSLIVGRLRGLSCKNAEITDLTCNNCSENCNNLPDLIDHLKSKHDISLRGTEHYLVPYKLQDGCPYQCLLCDEKFKSYMKLSIHMNSHFPYNVCERCGQSFINRRCLRMHVQCQHKEKKCSKCPAVFLTSASRIKHLRQAHGIKNTKRYCNLCNKHFLYTYMVDEHKIKEHGFKRPICNCPECGKTFCSPVNLKTHIRSVHIKERNYPCSKCGLRFFTKCDQKRHERTHEEFRSFCCTYCESKFKTKDSWRRHLRRQHGHVFGGVTLSKSDCTIE